MKQAARRKYHYIYKITCTVTGRWYIGRHSTDKLDDGYFGSGTDLAKSIRRHLQENHEKEILEFCDSRDAVIAREKELVTEAEVADLMCMNLVPGGDGGWEHYNNGPNFKSPLTPDIARKASKLGTEKLLQLHADSAWVTKWRAAYDIGMANRIYLPSNGMAGKIHSDLTKQKMKESHKSEKNSQFGKKWICKDLIAIRVKSEELQSWITQGWKLGRKPT